MDSFTRGHMDLPRALGHGRKLPQTTEERAAQSPIRVATVLQMRVSVSHVFRVEMGRCESRIGTVGCP